MSQLTLPLANDQVQYIIDGKLIPLEFPYLQALLQGRPRHGMDDFSHRHPQMERKKRAKLFAPFDALDGYSENIASKNITYTEKVYLEDRDKEELNRRLTILHNLTYNSRMAKANRVIVTAEYYVPCIDTTSFSCGMRGQYSSVTGIVWNVDMEVKQTITINRTVILFDDLLSITSEKEELFFCAWEE